MMHIIVDGYNLLRQSDRLRRFERVSLEEGRKALIRSVGAYRDARGHRVTIVFDGWDGGSPFEERDRLGGVDIVYSRRGEKADEVIKRMAERKEEETVVVTSDRGISDFVTHRGITAIPSPEFEALMERGGTEGEDAGAAEEDDRESERRGGKRKGPSRRLSRTRRDALARIRKL